jgi:ribosomal subunit interface protein
MIKRILFRNMEKSDVMEDYANGQLAKIENFLSHEKTPVYIDLTFEPSKTREHHKVELLVKSPNYDKIISYEHQGTGFYDVIDRVIDTMYLELHEAKKRLIEDRKMVGRHDEFKKQR